MTVQSATLVLETFDWQTPTLGKVCLVGCCWVLGCSVAALGMVREGEGAEGERAMKRVL